MVKIELAFVLNRQNPAVIYGILIILWIHFEEALRSFLILIKDFFLF